MTKQPLIWIHAFLYPTRVEMHVYIHPQIFFLLFVLFFIFFSLFAKIKKRIIANVPTLNLTYQTKNKRKNSEIRNLNWVSVYSSKSIQQSGEFYDGVNLKIQNTSNLKKIHFFLSNLQIYNFYKFAKERVQGRP